MRMKRTVKSALAMLLALLLTVSMWVPVSAETPKDNASAARVESIIENILAAGEYVEGEAIALIKTGESAGAFDSVTELSKVSSDSVELAVLDAEEPEVRIEAAAADPEIQTGSAEGSEGWIDPAAAAFDTQNDPESDIELEEEASKEEEVQVVSAAAEAKHRMALASSPTYSVQHVVDHSRTTAELLRELYADPNVIAAEPNYIIEAAADDMQLIDPSGDEADQPDVEITVPSGSEADDSGNDFLAPSGSEAGPDPEKPDSESIIPSESKEISEPEGSDPEFMTPGGSKADPDAKITIPSDSEAASSQDDLLENINGSEDSDFITPASVGGDDPVGIVPGDMTPLQWYTAGGGVPSTTPISPTMEYSLNVPGWAAGRNDESAPANSSGTVCIMDTGLDVTHPDIKDVLFTFSTDQQEKYGCGAHGLNASGDRLPAGDLTDFNSHGTHVAGIVAAQWNNVGTSGVAHGVKIFSVRIFNDGGASDEASGLKGFSFLIDVAKEVNLKAVNCSWGTMVPQFMYTVLVNELGKKGVNVVFASGNRALDLDEDYDTGSLNSIYEINVNAASPNGQPTDFTCFGQASTDVFSTGAQILSTVPKIVDMGGMGKYDHMQFQPEASAAEDLAFGIDRFREQETEVRFFSKNPAIFPEEARQIGTASASAGFDDKASITFNVKSLEPSGSGKDGGIDSLNGSVFLAIPVSSVSDAKWISVKCAMSDGFKPSGVLSSITCEAKDGSPVCVDMSICDALLNGIKSAASSSVYQCQWSNLSANINTWIETVNEAYEILKEPRDEQWLIDHGYTENMYLELLRCKQFGEVNGLYQWEDGSKNYIIAEVSLGPAQTSPAEDTQLYLDNVAVGKENAYVGAYVYMSGTSMAAPSVTGALAVIARDETPSWELSEDELEEQALVRAAKLFAAVDYDDSLTALCRTGGRVNLKEQSSFEKKAPLIRRSEVKSDVLNVDGYFFGQSGSLYIDGTQTPALSWSDGKITANVKSLQNGSHVLLLVNSDGVRMQDVFSTSKSDAAGKPLYAKQHKLPIYEQEFISEESQRLWGDAAACGGYLYTISTFEGFDKAKRMWKYDIAKDDWSPCSLPANYEQDSYNRGSLTALDETLYLCGDSPKGEDLGRTLWQYKPESDSWKQIRMDLPVNAYLCACQDKLFLVGGYYDKKKVQPSFAILDPKAKTVTPLQGSLPGSVSTDATIAASDDKIYFFYIKQDEKGNEEPVFIRAFYNEAAGKVSVTDLTKEFTAALGGNLDYWKGKDSRTFDKHFSLAGLPDGVAIVGSSVAGEDTHVIRDTGTKAESFSRTSSYHTPVFPVAAYYSSRLYAFGYNATEPDIMYFRSAKIAKDRLRITDATLKYSTRVYTGKARTQTNTTVVKCGKKVLKNGTDYKISYRNNVKVGTAEMFIRGIGAYKGTIKKTFDIIPEKTSIKSLTAGKNKMTVKWTKQAVQTSGYEIQYCLKSSFASGKKTAWVKSPKLVSKVISGLKSKKRYYVRIRTYKTVSGKKYYSAWSAKKSVVIK